MTPKTRSIGAILSICAVLLAGCGDAGDHFLEFKKNPSPTPTPSSAPGVGISANPSPSPIPTPPPPAAVAKITLSMPSTSIVRTQGGSYPLAVTAYDAKGNVIPPSTSFLYPISISSDSNGYISFTTAAAGASNNPLISISSTATQVYVSYNPCGGSSSGSCTGDSNTSANLTAVSPGSAPASFTLNFIAPPSLPGPPAVSTIALALVGQPTYGSAGTYPLQITAKDSSGNVIPLGSSFLYAISLTSNASCLVSFGTNPSILSYNTPTLAVSNTMTQVYVSYNPALANPSTCPGPPPTIVITATDPSVSQAAVLNF